MKRSEFKKWLDGGLRFGFSDDPEETIIAKMEEAAGPIQWEPEKFELPRRIVATKVVDCNSLHLLPEIHGIPLTEEQIRLIYEAAAEAYNRIQEGGPEAVVVGRALYDELCREVALGKKKLENVQRCGDRSDALVDRWKGVVERALAEVRHAVPSFGRIEAVLEERDPDRAVPREGAPDVITKTRREREQGLAVEKELDEEPAPHLLLMAGAVIEETEFHRHTVAAPMEAPGRTERNAKILADLLRAYKRVEAAGPGAVVVGRETHDELREAVSSAKKALRFWSTGEGAFRENEPLEAPEEMVQAYETLRRYFLGSGV